MQSQRPPKNCREAFTADGDQVFAGRYYSSEYTRPKFLSRDVDSEIRLVCNVALWYYSHPYLFFTVLGLRCCVGFSLVVARGAIL